MLQLFGTKYPENAKPKPSCEHNWHVWSSTGALAVLQTREYIQWLKEHPGDEYTINFANNSSASINPLDLLWQAMMEIAKAYSVEVYKLTLSGGYEEWSGESNSLRHFDAIRIKSK